MKSAWLLKLITSLVMAMAALLWVGCDTTHNPFLERHALEGWRFCADQKLSRSRLDKAIIEDCRSYLKTLSPEERKSVFENSIERNIEHNIRVLEDGAGQQAIEISIPLEGFLRSVWWDHILVYDANNKRIQTLKYKAGRSVR